MDKTNIKCAYCESIVEKPMSEVIRSNKLGRSMYCSLSCGAKHAAQKRDKKSKNVSEYNATPKLCKGCGTPISYDKRSNDYCTRSCAAMINNMLFPKRPARTVQVVVGENVVRRYLPLPLCKQCGNPVKTRNCKYCSTTCERDFRRSVRFRTVVEGNGSFKAVKSYLIHVHGNECMECGWNRVNPKTGNVPIELEHVDGNHENNTLENVKLLCPNCHSLTPTYKNLNKGRGRSSRRDRYHAGKSY